MGFNKMQNTSQIEGAAVAGIKPVKCALLSGEAEQRSVFVQACRPVRTVSVCVGSSD